MTKTVTLFRLIFMQQSASLASSKQRKSPIPLFLAIGSALILCAHSNKLHACTLWGAAGKEASGGTIICKNRDWKPDHVQVFKVHRSENGYAYFGLYAEGNDAPGLKQGVNEKGLSVTTATAGSIPKKTREAQSGKSGLMSMLLSNYANCDEVLADKDKLFKNRRPAFLMISDRNKILMLEIGLMGRYSVRTVKSGTVVHSNHYLEQELKDCNIETGASSATRAARISELLKAASKPFDTTSFTAMSRDTVGGPNNSLWRTGNTGSRTLSSWILETPALGPATLTVLIANPKQPQETHRYVLDETFWNKRSESRTIGFNNRVIPTPKAKP